MTKILSHPYPTPPRIETFDRWGGYICQMRGLGVSREGFGVVLKLIWAWNPKALGWILKRIWDEFRLLLCLQSGWVGMYSAVVPGIC